ncbi:winged helix-turn-helix domain-containing protein [Enterobacter quasiroggenkampii]|uniref:winged helix-turn-helix domain-containing protein n=1 Tax=Enterobacter quasiroggenkampii TaxID=2497436 RepID=UPI0021D336AA|nr:winged helix-turn-helix domain-containing protein [Enterobacter quasiroggenkampii]MCU6386095.1 winged helix-turn-helix domain-containing protein [Enterobacter quasiroggenkampii]MCU6395196.1 winged helix-turn-helix domain-containing protein [Enterobacter quasiroggenkampii]MCU6404275.1 winged helix-turn-helix domain-containing protein [Enterobacter quasiroggenkampii]MCU6417849.1 winged helix-turn-helix domain-containing protein [Enterobacter quasiroggenkampii]
MPIGLFGYLINDDIQVDIHNRRIIRLCIDDEHKILSVNVRMIHIKENQMCLLSFLLQNSSAKIIKRDDILDCVWEKRGYRSSYQTLWVTLKELRENLSLIGLDNDFITKNGTNGYTISAKRIRALTMSNA